MKDRSSVLKAIAIIILIIALALLLNKFNILKGYGPK